MRWVMLLVSLLGLACCTATQRVSPELVLYCDGAEVLRTVFLNDTTIQLPVPRNCGDPKVEVK